MQNGLKYKNSESFDKSTCFLCHENFHSLSIHIGRMHKCKVCELIETDCKCRGPPLTGMSINNKKCKNTIFLIFFVYNFKIFYFLKANISYLSRFSDRSNKRNSDDKDSQTDVDSFENKNSLKRRRDSF